jgi:hypothetical protein
MNVTQGNPNSVVKRFTIDKGTKIQVYDQATKKAYDYVRVDAKFSTNQSKHATFQFHFRNDPKQ